MLDGWNVFMRQDDQANHNPPAASSTAIARNNCFAFIVFLLGLKPHIHFRDGIVRRFVEVGYRFGTKAGYSGAKRRHAGMNLVSSGVNDTLEIAIRSTPSAASTTLKRRKRSTFFESSARWKSRGLPEFQLLLDFANRTRGGIALFVLQQDQVLALERWLKLLDLIHVDDD